MHVFATGLLSPWKLCICVEGLSMCRHSNEGNPLTEHVQSVYWACAGNYNEGKSSDDPKLNSVRDINSLSLPPH